MESWAQLKKYLRSKKVGTLVTRANIMKYDEDAWIIMHNPTIDTYINDLKNANVLETVKPGHYKINYRLQKRCKITSIRNYNQGDWKPWFKDELFEDESE